MQESIHQSLTDVFRSVFQNPELTITSEMTAQDVSDWDSFMHVNLIVEIESVFNIKFALGELQDLKNVGTLEKLILQKLAARGGK